MGLLKRSESPNVLNFVYVLGISECLIPPSKGDIYGEEARKAKQDLVTELVGSKAAN